MSQLRVTAVKILCFLPFYWFSHQNKNHNGFLFPIKSPVIITEEKLENKQN